MEIRPASWMLDAAARYERALQIKAAQPDDLTRPPITFSEASQSESERNPTKASSAPRRKVTEDRARFLASTDRLALERRIGADDLKPIRFMELALIAARSVCRIVVPNVDPRGDLLGTGFLVAPGLLVTNHHILEEPYWAEAARAEFGAEDDLSGRPKPPEMFSLNPQQIYFADKELDFAIVAVASASLNRKPIEDYGYLRVFIETGKIKEGEYANLIQHPNGRQKEICVRNNKLTVYNADGTTDPADNNFLYYEADTEGGSSGSPVFNDQWYVVALHRQSVPALGEVGGRKVILRKDGTPAERGDPDDLIKYVANEGVRGSRIIKRMEKAIASQDPMAIRAYERWRDVSVPPSAGPFPLPAPSSSFVASAARPVASPAIVGALELVVRSEAKFANAGGFNTGFLGERFETPLPELASEVARDVAPLRNGQKAPLRYDNFSVLMNAGRRMAFYAAWNINGKNLFDPGARPRWSYDPRMEERFQPDDEIFSQQLQRGHIVRRLDVAWGRDGERAHEHTFCLPNAMPQIGAFNNQEWGDLEDHILDTTDEADAKVSVFAGPIFDSQDPFYADLRRGGRRRNDSGMRVPLDNWKIVAWIDGAQLKAAGFIRNQQEELEAAGPLELSFGGAAQEQTLISHIETRTGLRFDVLRERDTLPPTGLTRREIRRREDIIL